jgi:CheY-like chemotaxis protein
MWHRSLFYVAAAENMSVSVKLRVLVAEDNPVNGEIVVYLLQRLGCEAVLVADGASAVESFCSGKFDLVLMDGQMPVMSGIDATKSIRDFEAQGTKRVPIVALSGSSLEVDVQKFLSAGMDGFLAKPVTQIALENVFLKWFPSLMEVTPS